jgi:alpha-glucosidase
MARSTYEAARKHMKDNRPFVLTRAGFSGVQRYAAVWTGDNVAYDEHMILGSRMVSNMGLAGIAFAGYDIGGFVGDTNSKLFARWISIGVFSPFCRAHSMINSRDSEPWSYGEEVEQIARNYIKFRYQLLPYIYSLFYEASQTGMPLQRSMAVYYPHAPWTYDHQFHNQYLFGPSILVAPVESHKDFVKIYFPEGDWYYLFNGKKHAGGGEAVMECPVHKLPLFIKAGAIIPMQPAKSSTTEPAEELFIHVYEGKEATSFTHYEDNGATYEYTKGDFSKRLIEYHPASNQLILHACEGDFKSPVKKIKVIFHAFSFISIYLNGTMQVFKAESNLFFPALEKFDPFYDPEPIMEEPVKTITLNYTRDQIDLSWK